MLYNACIAPYQRYLYDIASLRPFISSPLPLERRYLNECACVRATRAHLRLCSRAVSNEPAGRAVLSLDASRIHPSFITVTCPLVQCNNTLITIFTKCCVDTANLDKIIKIERWALRRICLFSFKPRRLRSELCRDLWATNLHVISSFIGRLGLFILLSTCVPYEWVFRATHCDQMEIALKTDWRRYDSGSLPTSQWGLFEKFQVSSCIAGYGTTVLFVERSRALSRWDRAASAPFQVAFLSRRYLSIESSGLVSPRFDPANGLAHHIDGYRRPHLSATCDSVR